MERGEIRLAMPLSSQWWCRNHVGVDRVRLAEMGGQALAPSPSNVPISVAKTHSVPGATLDVDPASCRARLRQASADPGLPMDGAATRDRGRAAGFALAVAVGRCELLGVWPRPTTGGLSPAVVDAALRELCERYHRLTADLDHLDPAASSSDLLGMLGRRIEAWSAFVAGADDDSGLMSAVLDAGDACEAAMERAAAPLLHAAALPVVRRWRDALASPYRDLPPWWLGDEGE